MIMGKPSLVRYLTKTRGYKDIGKKGKKIGKTWRKERERKSLNTTVG